MRIKTIQYIFDRMDLLTICLGFGWLQSINYSNRELGNPLSAAHWFRFRFIYTKPGKNHTQMTPRWKICQQVFVYLLNRDIEFQWFFFRVYSMFKKSILLFVCFRVIELLQYSTDLYSFFLSFLNRYIEVYFALIYICISNFFYLDPE